MKLTRFKVTNYKSVIDSGYCTLSPDLTILIGKNESGKSSILEALRDFDKSVGAFSLDVYPIDGRMDEPEVEAHFTVEKDELDRIQAASSFKCSEDAYRYILTNGMTVTKNGQGRYGFKDEILRPFAGNAEDDINIVSEQELSRMRGIREQLFELLPSGHPLPELNAKSLKSGIHKSAKEIIGSVKTALGSVHDEGLQTKIVEILRAFMQEAEELSKEKKKTALLFIDSVVEHLPHFVFFREFEDTLPFEIDLVSLKESQPVRDFAKIAGLDLDRLIETKDLQKRINVLNRHSALVSGDFLEFWGQNRVEMIVKPEGEKIVFAVRDYDSTNIFKFSQRSKGFQWFLSFYLRLNAKAGKDSIIIIDEPGTNLHAKAQGEVLKVLVNRIAPKSRVIFSTHSPYLIDVERPDRIRLVMKSAQSGSILREDLKDVEDEDTLAPLMTARGLEKQQPAAVSVPAGKSVILSGSAFYYLKALNKFVKDEKMEALNLYPVSGTEQAMRMVSLMIGQNSEFVVLLEQDPESRALAGQLRDKFALDEDRIVFTSVQQGTGMEDLFTGDDFNQHVLAGNKNEDTSVANSQYLLKDGINRVAVSKAFFKEEKEITLSDETLKGVRALFDRILIALKEMEAPVQVEVEEDKQEKEPEVRPRRSLFDYLRK